MQVTCVPPGGMSEFPFHAIKDTRGDQRTEGVADQTAAREQSRADTELFAGVPLGEEEQCAGEERGLNEAEEETGEECADEVLGHTGQAGDHAPDHHADGQVDGRPAGVVEQHVPAISVRRADSVGNGILTKLTRGSA